MPAAPPESAFAPLPTRLFVPRLHTTTLPDRLPGANGVRHSSLAGAGTTTSESARTPSVMDAPSIESDAPPSATRSTRFTKERLCVLAATVVTQGPRWSVVLAPGPLLPAEAAT